MRVQSARHCAHLLAFLLFASWTGAQIKRYHPDIQNIGNRDLNMKIWGKFGKLPTMTDENALGAELSRQFETTAKLLSDAPVIDYVTRLGDKLVRHSDAKSPIQFKIVDSEQPDFTVLPGGHVWVNTGLIIAAPNEAELAAVLSNAIAHIAAHHLMKELSKGQILQISAIPATAMAWHWSKLEWYGTNNGQMTGLGINLELKGVKREHAKEADQLAIQYLWNTGYDPAAYIAVLRKLPNMQLKIQDRIDSAMMEVQSLPDKRPYLVNSPEFDAVKSHLLKRK